ncbi:Protein of unknown function [Ruaniaceae bacterium KH17]|nr:Protein of unknown function [Ruaniaceae bacterium KH17]
MSVVRDASRAAVLTAAVLALAAPTWIGGELNDAPARQIGRPVAADAGSAARVVPSLESKALGPVGDPLLMAGELSMASGVLISPEPEVDDWAVTKGEVEHAGPGTFQVAEDSEDAPEPSLKVRTVLVRVEDGLPIDVDRFGDVVMDVLNAPQGWRDKLGVSFARTDQPSDANVVLTLATPSTTDELCYPVKTNGRVSCGRTTTVTINANNWVYATEPFLDAGGSLETYRQYVLNHEIGHFLGQPHVPCPTPGAVAPVMLQQSLRLQGCVPNGWPNP